MSSYLCPLPNCELCSQHKSHREHVDAMLWKHFPCWWPVMMEMHRSSVDSFHKVLVSASMLLWHEQYVEWTCQLPLIWDAMTRDVTLMVGFRFGDNSNYRINFVLHGTTLHRLLWIIIFAMLHFEWYFNSKSDKLAIRDTPHAASVWKNPGTVMYKW